VKSLREGSDWERDEHARNVQLTAAGVERVETELGCANLHAAECVLLLAEVNQALHARALLRRDVDYIVRDGQIALVDPLTGRVVPDRRWPDGLQAALEAKEGLLIRPGGRILGTITLRNLLAQYPALAGMTATAQPAAAELADLYGMRVVPVRANRPCIREDLPDLVFTHREAKERALVREIGEHHETGRPVLVGTCSVEESEHLAAVLAREGIACRVLNAKNDEAEAEIIAEAGAVGAVTLSTNMAGRGTDIRLGGADGRQRDHVMALGGLFVIGTNRHESRRIDDQLRGRAGRQGDPGSSRFLVSLEDPLLVRFGIQRLLPRKRVPPRQEAPIEDPIVAREVGRLQRIVEGQNREICATLARYTAIMEAQRATLHDWRAAVLAGDEKPGFLAARSPKAFEGMLNRFGPEKLGEAERAITLHHIDAAWADHLAYVAELRDGIHLVSIGGMDPLEEFHNRVAPAFGALHKRIEERTIETLLALSAADADMLDPPLSRPTSTWTYLINDKAVTELQRMLHGPDSTAFSAAAVLMAWPLLLGWGAWQRLRKRDP
jgi:preprotein translocase subunit SecA